MQLSSSFCSVTQPQPYSQMLDLTELTVKYLPNTILLHLVASDTRQGETSSWKQNRSTKDKRTNLVKGLYYKT